MINFKDTCSDEWFKSPFLGSFCPCYQVESLPYVQQQLGMQSEGTCSPQECPEPTAELKSIPVKENFLDKTGKALKSGFNKGSGS